MSKNLATKVKNLLSNEQIKEENLTSSLTKKSLNYDGNTGEENRIQIGDKMLGLKNSQT